MEQVRLWQANSLPVPFGALFERPEETIPHQEVDVNDNYPKGVVHRYFPYQGLGFIKDRVGRDILFKLSEMNFVGPKGKDSLAEGIAVGYDLTHVGRGLHVKRMKIY